MANKRVSQLAPITVLELSPTDLFLLADVTANESKKLTLGDLTTYMLQGGLQTGSFFGTASWAINTLSASYSPPTVSSSFAFSSSIANRAITSSFALLSAFAQSSTSSSYAATASFTTIQTVATASLALVAALARSSSFLIYTPGVSNGTASYAVNALTASFALNGGGGGTGSISSSYSSNSGQSETSSYLLYTGIDNGTASLALLAQLSYDAGTSTSASHALYADFATVGITNNFQSSASWASQSLSASYATLAVSANSAITASYVLPNPNISSYGVFNAISQSLSKGQIDTVSLTSSIDMTASFDARGTLIVPYTSSVQLSESLALHILDRTIGADYVLDLLPVYYYIGNASTFAGSITGSFTGSIIGAISGSTDSFATITGSITGSATGSMSGFVNGTITNQISGTFTMPFDLIGQFVAPSNDYMVYVTASSDKIKISPNRGMKFVIDVNGGNITVSTGNPLQLTTNNANDIITFSGSGTGPFQDTAINIVASGSNNVRMMDLSALTANIHYIWTLPLLNTLKSNGNGPVTNIGGIPSSLVSMSMVNGALDTLYTMTNTSMSYLNVNNNILTEIPALPSTMSYIDVSNNPLTSIPSIIPYGVTNLFCSNTQITSAPSTLPNQIVSMSFSANSLLSLWITTLPTSLGSFDLSFCPLLTSIPTIPSNVRFLDVSNCSLTNTVEDNICANLVTNGLLSGSLNLLNNAPVLPATITKIATLQGRAWTVSY